MPYGLARELVLTYGWNATSCQILNPGIDHWFSPTTRAVVGYTRRGRTMNVAGSPVCDPKDLSSVCREFEDFAKSAGCRVCYVCAEDRLQDLFAGCSEHVSIVMGAQPAWDPNDWPQITSRDASLRAQLSRALNKGVVVERWPAEQAATSSELHEVLADWLGSRRLPPLHFLVEPDILTSAMRERVVLVARDPKRVVAFLVASPIVAKKGYLVELLARRPDAPNGSSELLIDNAMRCFAADDCRYITLGLVALATAADDEMHRNPIWLRAAMKFARAHANRFYNFQGLERFRVKMRPMRWETVYAISNERHFSIRTLYDIGSAFAGMSPVLAVGIGIGKAIREEMFRHLPS